MRRLGKTPPFLAQDGEPRPDSIAEINHLRLGGLDQWVMIRGENISNPPLVLLHGGRSFTVVYWDQRGAGKSFARTIPRSTMTVE